MKRLNYTCNIILSVFLIALLGFYVGGCNHQKKKAESPSGDQPAQTSPAAETVSFANDIKPIFESNCAPCHISGKSGGLKLASYADLMAGGEDGKVVVESDSANSVIIGHLEGTVPPRMPLGRDPLDNALIQKIKDWIDAGAKDN